MRGNPQGRRFSKENNALWPLPADYWSLDERGQRLARLNCVLTQQTPADCVAAWRFFCLYYLQPDEAGRWGKPFNSYFYTDWKPFGSIHNKMIYWFEEHPLLALAIPRGHAKTTTIQSYCLMKGVTNKQCEINVYVSKYKPYVIKWSDKIAWQLENNRRLIEDFGDLRPGRGKGAWQTELRRLNNFSSFLFHSIDGQLRGSRGRFNICDDTDQEDDNVLTPNPDKLAASMKRLQAVLLPMLDEGTGMVISGTPRQGTLLSHILDANEHGKDVKDPAFLSVEMGGDWKKYRMGSKDGSGNLLWEGKITQAFLDAKRRNMGELAFSSEYMCEELAIGDQFKIDPVLNEYTIENPDEYVTSNPWVSNAYIRYTDVQLIDGKIVDRKEVVRPWREFLADLVRIVVCDPATSTATTADDCAIQVGGMDHRGVLWSLDMFAEKGMTGAKAADVLWDLTLRWRCSIIGIENINFQDEWRLITQDKVQRMADTADFVPQVLGLKPPTGTKKEDRIAGVAWRFPYGRMKLPSHRRWEPAYDKLYRQIIGFGKPQRHDDCIETVEFLQRIFKTSRPAAVDAPIDPTPLQRLAAGELVDEASGVKLTRFVDIRSVPADLRDKILQQLRIDRMSGDDDGLHDVGEDQEYGTSLVQEV